MAKRIADRLCELAQAIFPDEWPGKYTATQEELRDWLNDKTGINACHLTNKDAALGAWVEKLEGIKHAAEHPA